MRSELARLVALAVALAALSGCIAPATPDCDAPFDCESCLTASGCGYCGDPYGAGECVPGSSLGPRTGGCTPGDWYFASCFDPSTVPSGDPCASNSYCSTCSDEDGCAWCPEEERCASLDRLSASCTAVTVSDDCYAAACAIHTTCSDCHGAGCYWCDVSGGVCQDSLATCAPIIYSYSPHGDGCPAPNDCSSHFDCESCVEDPNCGYCDYIGTSLCISLARESDPACDTVQSGSVLACR